MTKGRLRKCLVLASSILSAGCGLSTRQTSLRPRALACGVSSPRWETDASTRPLRVGLVIDTDGSQGWRGNGESRLREAMASWNRLKLPAEFRSVQDAGTADVQVFIVRHLPSDSSRDHVSRDYRSGLTRLTLDARGRIVRAHVAVATHAPRGAAYGVEDQTSTLLHELGHVLGLPHSEGSMTLMAARHVVDAITDEDARLARAVYARAPCSSSSVANR